MPRSRDAGAGGAGRRVSRVGVRLRLALGSGRLGVSFPGSAQHFSQMKPKRGPVLAYPPPRGWERTRVPKASQRDGRADCPRTLSATCRRVRLLHELCKRHCYVCLLQPPPSPPQPPGGDAAPRRRGDHLPPPLCRAVCAVSGTWPAFLFSCVLKSSADNTDRSARTCCGAARAAAPPSPSRDPRG